MRNLDDMPQEARELYFKHAQALEDKKNARIAEIERLNREAREFWKTVEFPAEVPGWMRQYYIDDKIDIPADEMQCNLNFKMPGMRTITLETRYRNEQLFSSGEKPWFVTNGFYGWKSYSTLEEAIYQTVNDDRHSEMA